MLAVIADIAYSVRMRLRAGGDATGWGILKKDAERG